MKNLFVLGRICNSASSFNPNLGGVWQFYPAPSPLLVFPQSSDIAQNPDGVISDFWISGQSLIKENCHNSRTSDDIDMTLGPVTKLYKRNKTTSVKVLFLPKSIRKIKMVLLLKGIFSETAYVFVLTCQIRRF